MSIEAELKLSSTERAKLGAFRNGRKDALAEMPKDPSLYGARKNSMWANWYIMGFDGLPFPQKWKDLGIDDLFSGAESK